MMVIAVGLSSYNIALFHLVNHAFYKGLLFLGAGAVIHAVGDNQDFRRYGGLISFLPLTYSVMLIASLSLVAFPFMTGFYSKDFILESAFGQYYFSSIAVYVIAVIGAIFTTLYSVKVLYLTFLAYPNGPRVNYGTHSHSQIIYQSELIYNLLLEYAGKISQLAGSVKMSMPMGVIWDRRDELIEKIKGLNYLDSSFTIDPYKFQSLLNEIQTSLWEELVKPYLKRGYIDRSLEKNYITDYVENISIAINKYSQDLNRQQHAHEGDIFLSLPLVILAMFSIFFGYITKDIFIGLGSSFFIDNSIFIHPVHEIIIETEFGVPTIFKLLPFVFTVIFSMLAIIFSEYLPESLISFKLSRFGYNLFGFFNQRFLVEMFYNKYITNLVLNLGGQTTKVLDKGSIELLGPFGLELGLVKLSKAISSLSTGVVTSYALYILIGFIGYLSVAFWGLWSFKMVLLLILAIFSLSIFSYYYGYNENKNKFLQSNFFKSLLCLFYKIQDIISSYWLLIWGIYMLIVLVCKLYNFFDTPEGFISYASEPNKENLTGDGSQYVYRSLADKVHDDIKKIDEDIKKLDPNSINYLKDKEKLESIRSEFENQMSLVGQFKSSRAKHIPEISDNKRVADNNITADTSKRRRD